MKGMRDVRWKAGGRWRWRLGCCSVSLGSCGPGPGLRLCPVKGRMVGEVHVGVWGCGCGFPLDQVALTGTVCAAYAHGEEAGGISADGVGLSGLLYHIQGPWQPLKPWRWGGNSCMHACVS